jgi:hypothetical protein
MWTFPFVSKKPPHTGLSLTWAKVDMLTKPDTSLFNQEKHSSKDIGVS